VFIVVKKSYLTATLLYSAPVFFIAFFFFKFPAPVFSVFFYFSVFFFFAKKKKTRSGLAFSVFFFINKKKIERGRETRKTLDREKKKVKSAFFYPRYLEKEIPNCPLEGGVNVLLAVFFIF